MVWGKLFNKFNLLLNKTMGIILNHLNEIILYFKYFCWNSAMFEVFLLTQMKIRSLDFCSLKNLGNFQIFKDIKTYI